MPSLWSCRKRQVPFRTPFKANWCAGLPPKNCGPSSAHFLFNPTNPAAWSIGSKPGRDIGLNLVRRWSKRATPTTDVHARLHSEQFLAQDLLAGAGGNDLAGHPFEHPHRVI